MVKVSTLTTIMQAAEKLEIHRPSTGNVQTIRKLLANMPDERLSELFWAVDTIILNCKLLGHEVVEVA